MNRKSGKPAPVRCSACGNSTEDTATRPLAGWEKTYQVVIACASCGTSFVALSRN